MGTHHPHAVSPGRREQLALSGGAESLRAGEPGREDDRGTHPRSEGVAHDVGDPVRGDDDHHEVDRFGDCGQCAVDRQAGEGVCLRVYDVEPAGETGGLDGLEHAATQSPEVASDADHGHTVRREQGAQRARLGAPLASIRGVDGGRGRLGAQLHRHLAVLGMPRHREAGRSEHPEHPVVVCEYLGLETVHTVLAAHRREVLEQQAPQAPAPILVGHQERHFGPFSGQQLRGRQGCDATADHGDQSGRSGVGRIEQVRDIGPTGRRARGEEAQPQGVLRDAFMQRQHLVAILRRERADDRNRAVRQEDVVHGHRPVPWRDGDVFSRHSASCASACANITVGSLHGARG